MKLCTYRTFFANLFTIYCATKITDSCSVNCLIGQSHCDSVTGTCLYGCKPGWSGDTCSEQCNIPNCVECYTFKNNTQICDRCKDRFYGDQCTETCSDFCLLGRCNAAGDCVFGCKTHWTGRKCDQQHCDIEYCLKCGFSMLYYIPICDICSVGKFYSILANKCVNCSDKCIGGSDSCNQTTGICFHGCEQGFYGTNCDRLCSINNCEQCVLANSYNDKAKCGLCSPGWYPENFICVKCSKHCLGGVSNCNSSTGHCATGCEVGWFGSRCDKQCLIHNCYTCAEDRFKNTFCSACNSGMYFNYDNGSCLDCSDACSGGKLHCDMKTGVCLNGCKSGYYGDQCQWACGQCVGPSCYLNGTCPHGCEPGWYTSYCTQRYPEHCIDGIQFFHNGKCGDCEAFWYGDICDKECSDQCRPSVYNGYTYCHKQNGRCIAGCLTGYYGDTCNKTCSSNCNYQQCDQTTGICQNGCELAYYSPYCDIKCPENCDGGCHRELGTCNECQPGYYGSLCELQCSEGCKDKRCVKIHGACSDGCNHGYYGNKCTVNCSETCLNTMCNPFDGKCTAGCVDGYYGQFCQFECSTCKNSTCHPVNGVCYYGCVLGMTGENCDHVCPSGTYGENCGSSCSFCRNEACDTRTGECQFGCAVGYTGSLCQDVVPLYPTSNSASHTDTIAIASSVSVSIALTIGIIVVVFIIVRRKTNFSSCTKTRKSNLADHDTPGIEMETIQPTRGHHIVESTIDPADLQLYPVIVTGQRFQIKFGKYCNTYRTSPVMVRILPNKSDHKDIEDFNRDVEILKSLPKQKNIVFFLGTGNNAGYSFSMLELCESGVMLSYLRNMAQSCGEHTPTILKTNLYELMKCCLGVVSGLEYLLYRKILHRHIAANNIFLDENKRSKIGNFFYAVTIQSETEEIKLSQLPDDCLPWLPEESIKQQIFSSKSEIYSFGVFLWEVMTLGENVGIVKQKLSTDQLLPEPDGCDRILYCMMTKCWNEDPQHRPTLNYIYQLISDLIDDPVDQIDIEEEFTLKATTV